MQIGLSIYGLSIYGARAHENPTQVNRMRTQNTYYLSQVEKSHRKNPVSEENNKFRVLPPRILSNEINWQKL